jgi:hypothetical protein
LTGQAPSPIRWRLGGWLALGGYLALGGCLGVGVSRGLGGDDNAVSSLLHR